MGISIFDRAFGTIKLIHKYANDDNILEQFLVGSSGLRCCFSRRLDPEGG